MEHAWHTRASCTPARARRRRKCARACPDRDASRARCRGPLPPARSVRDDARGRVPARVELESFDRQFRAACEVQHPDRYRLLDALRADEPRIARSASSRR